ncbi:MAG: macrolide ABC transporter ATP-binding protein [Elusimicrobia bacterium RIFCSPLOWO2_12_FULL_59_9]|nr:MAG: macrolide ABC transporter ATP-binding protein [Elusimicrobia bacterium RIFCSPLOWO2_12_FULL_59_9]
MQPLIEIQKVTKIYEAAAKVRAVCDFSADIFPGEFAAIAGPSGSGKSTLLNLIGTLDTPTRGEILFEGRRVSQLTENQLADFRLRSLGFVFQAFNLIPVLTAFENVEYVLILQGVPKAERSAKTLEALKWVGLDKLADRRPDLLSGGQQQRVAVARSIVHRPLLVLADEPTANLDSKTSAELMDLMADLNEKHGITFLFSSHDPLVLSRAKRVIYIRDGMLQANES